MSELVPQGRIHTEQQLALPRESCSDGSHRRTAKCTHNVQGWLAVNLGSRITTLGTQSSSKQSLSTSEKWTSVTFVHLAFIETCPVPGSVPGPGEMLVKLTGWRGDP